MEKTPYKVWYGKNPSLHYMKVWGCVAHGLILHHQVDKLKTKTKRCFFVGYPSLFKGYLLYDLMDKIIIESRNVKFLEDHFGCEEYLSEKDELLERDNDDIVGVEQLENENDYLMGVSLKKKENPPIVEPTI